jgi:hypothetical protein
MTFKLRNTENNKIVHFLITLLIISNIGGFCIGYLIGEHQECKRQNHKTLLIEKEINKVS